MAGRKPLPDSQRRKANNRMVLYVNADERAEIEAAAAAAGVRPGVWLRNVALMAARTTD